MKTENFLIHNIDTTTKDGDQILIKIRLSDPCKNGHNDFAITADIWAKGNRNMIMGGCCHEEILKVRPDLKQFVDLHLCDFNGAPMHPSANGFYFLNDPKSTNHGSGRNHLEVAQEYIRATDEEMKTLRTAEDELHFKYLIETLGIVDRWKVEANQAIAALEELTQTKFEDNSTRSQYTPLTDEERKLITERLAYGYYTPERIEERRHGKIQAKKLKVYARLVEDRDKVIKKAENEYAVKCAVLNAGLPIDNAIYYDHSNELVFNWMDSPYYEKITAEQFDTFVKNVDVNKLPKGIVFKLGKDKK